MLSDAQYRLYHLRRCLSALWNVSLGTGWRGFVGISFWYSEPEA
jgi:hypothetical protein